MKFSLVFFLLLFATGVSFGQRNNLTHFNVFKQVFHPEFQWFLAFGLFENSKLICCLKS